MKKLIFCMCLSASLLLLSVNSLQAQIGYPPSVSVSAKTETSVTLSWTPVSTVEGYHIFYKPDTLYYPYPGAQDAGVVSIRGAGSNGITITGLASNSTYTFCVYGDTIDIHSNKTFSYSGTCVQVLTENKKMVELDFEQAASVVIGQRGPESNLGANMSSFIPSSYSLDNPAGVWVAPASGSNTTNGQLFIADARNNRVVIHNYYPTANEFFGPSADLYIGQGMWQSNAAGSSRKKFNNPSGICTATFGDTTYLIICDQGNHRIMVYNSIPGYSGEHDAWKVFGQSSWTGNSPACSQSRLNNPVAVCTSGRKLIVADRDNNRVMIWNNFTDPATAPFAGNASVVVGQNSFSSFSSPDQCSGASNKATLSSPYGVAVSTFGKLVVASRLEHRVLIYNNVPTVNGDSASIVLGQPDFSSNCYSWGAPTASNMGFLRGVSISGSQYTDEKLSLIDIVNNRIMVWNTFPQSNNQQADVVLNKPNLTAQYSTQFSNEVAYNLNAHNYGWPEYSCFAPNGDFLLSDAGLSRVNIFPKAAGDMSASGLTVTAVSDSTISLSWTGNTQLYKIKFKAGTYATDSEIDSIPGFTYTLTKLRCNTQYTIQVIPRIANPLRYGNFKGSSVDVKTSAGLACANVIVGAGANIKVTATYGNIIYLAGGFTQINGQSRNGLAALNATTYELLPFNPNVTGGINSMKVSTNGQYLYIAGNITAVGATTTYGIAKISTVTGNAVSYPSLNMGGTVRHASLTPGTDYFFIMGNFTSVGAVAGFSFCAGIDDSDRVMTNFKPVIEEGKNSDQLRSIAATPDNRYVYIGHGNNETIRYKDVADNMSPRNGLAEFRVSDGLATSFDPYPDSKGVFDIACTNASLYFCGSFDIMKNSGNAPRRRVAKYSGGPGSWTLDANFAPSYPYNGPNKSTLLGDSLAMAELRAIVLNKNRVYVYGHVSNYGGTPRYGIIALDSGNASLIPEFNLGVNDLSSITDSRMCHSDTLNKIIASVFGKSVSFISANLYTMDFICGRSDSTTVGSGSDRFVAAPGLYDFNSAQTAIKIYFNDVSAAANLTVERYKDAAQNVSGITENNISKYRFVIHKFEPGTTQFSKATIKFKVSAIPSSGITDPATVKVYVRNTYGFGPFRLVDSMYYDNANGEINAVLKNFDKAEFVLASSNGSNPFLQRNIHAPVAEQVQEPAEQAANTMLAADLPASNGLVPQGAAAFRVYPNPAHDYVVLSIPFSAKGELQIMDLKGRTVQKASVSNGEKLELDKLGKGIYLLRVINPLDGAWYVQKLAVR